jgi:hypothetical protein
LDHGGKTERPVPEAQACFFAGSSRGRSSTFWVPTPSCSASQSEAMMRSLAKAPERTLKEGLEFNEQRD